MMTINVNELLSAFSLALDIAENKTLEHARRTAYIALKISREMGFPENQLKDIYTAALLHDIGMVNALADVHTDQSLLVQHCITGEEIVKTLPLSPRVCDFVLWHHANWDGSGPHDRVGREIPMGAQIVYLADQLDLQLKELKDSYAERQKIIDFVKEASGTRFCPELVEAFLSVQAKEVFWLDYNHYNLSEVVSRIEPVNETMIDMEGLEKIALTFAKIIDNKSPFTHEHSLGVSNLLSKLSSSYGFNDETTKMLEISGLLHDLGKLAIPNEILDKPGQLTPYEFQRIKSHSYYTKLILSNVKEFKDIKEWAGNHHETLDGRGYPEGLPGHCLSQQERMVAICDLYQALTEVRPYRKPLPQTKVYEIMGELSRHGKICPEVFADLKKIMD